MSTKYIKKKYKKDLMPIDEVPDDIIRQSFEALAWQLQGKIDRSEHFTIQELLAKFAVSDGASVYIPIKKCDECKRKFIGDSYFLYYADDKKNIGKIYCSEECTMVADKRELEKEELKNEILS